MPEDKVNWEEPALKRWLGSISKAGTKANYRSAFRAYAKYTSLTATELIDEALEDARRDIRERKDVVLTRLVGFYHWLKKDWEVKSRGAGEHQVVRRGTSDSLANLWVSAIRSFYETFEITVRLKGRHRLPRPRVTNRRMKLGADQVKVLVDHARTPRDRALILTMFQSGMDVSTLCSLKYGDIQEALTRGYHPVKLEVYRPKTGVEYYTFLGKDAVEALKLYIKDLAQRGAKLTPNSPLFIKERSGGEPLETYLVQNMMAELAVKAGFVDEENNGKDFNPLSPHALRESFGSIMINSGVPDSIVDFWLGHSIGEMAEAYKGVQYESLRKMYLERERLLSISQPPVDPAEIDRKVEVKVDERIQGLQRVIGNYAAENLELKARLDRLEKAYAQTIKDVEELHAFLEKPNAPVEAAPEELIQRYIERKKREP